MQTVHLRITDASTGKPTPVRLRLLDGQGRYHAPLGRLATFPTDQAIGGQVQLGPRGYAYIDGACEVNLPPGPIHIEATKGPEYAPLEREVNLAAGQLSLRFTIERWADWREQGWYAGDIRAHALSPHAALLEGAGEGLAVVQLLAREAGAEILAFSGDRACLQNEECLVAVNTLNVHPDLGTVALLDSHRPVFPLRSGPPSGEDFWSVADWCDQCHRKKGLVVWPRPAIERTQAEALAALLLGKVDAFEVCSDDVDDLAPYYALLSAGARPALVAGSGKASAAVALGAVRTYARLKPAASLGADTWSEAVRAGRTFITTGPLLALTANGAGPGERLTVHPGQRVALVAEATGTRPFDHLELIANDVTLASKPTSGNRQATRLEAELKVEEHTWVAARCYAEARDRDGLAFAHTSPIYLEAVGRPGRPRAGAIATLLPVLDEGLSWVNQAAFASERWRGHVRDVLTAARLRLVPERAEGD